MSTTMTKQEIETRLNALVKQDESFQQKLIDNPSLALEQAGLGHLSNNTSVKVVDKNFLEELSDEELESVSGGRGELALGDITITVTITNSDGSSTTVTATIKQ